MSEVRSEEYATCRGCGMQLDGKPYYMGGRAYVPEAPGQKRREAKVNHYGGFVCSHACDYRASVRQVQSMPGCAGATTPDCYAKQRIQANWPEHYA